MRHIQVMLENGKDIAGVSAADTYSKANGLDEALDDAKNGRVTEYKSKGDFFKRLGI